MQTITYVNQSFQKGRLARWPDGVMPLRVYIAKYRWYQGNQHDEYKYTQMIIDAFNLWEKLTNGIVSFERVMSLYDSNINIDWRRVDRKSLGNCMFNYDKLGRYFSAEVQIGLSDGIIHHQYMDENEVFHTIIHEIGHSVGLGHSPTKGDIMYVPHQYGVTQVTQNDVATLKWLYKLPVTKTPQEIIAMYPNVSAKSVDELIYKISGEKSEFEKTKDALMQSQNSRNLHEENANIGDLKRYQMQLNNLNINIDKSKFRK